MEPTGLKAFNFDDSWQTVVDQVIALDDEIWGDRDRVDAMKYAWERDPWVPTPVTLNANPFPRTWTFDQQSPINFKSTPISFNSTPISFNLNSTPMGFDFNSTPMGFDLNSTPMGFNSTPLDFNSTPMDFNSTPTSFNFNSTPTSFNSNSTPMSFKSNSTPMSFNSNSTPISFNSTPISFNSSPVEFKTQGNLNPTAEPFHPRFATPTTIKKKPALGTTRGDMIEFAERFGYDAEPRPLFNYRPRKGKYRKEFLKQ